MLWYFEYGDQNVVSCKIGSHGCCWIGIG